MALTDLFGGAIKQQLISMVSQKLGINEQMATTAVNFALPLLLNGLAKNSSTQEGANSLHQAVVNDHDGSILSNLAGFMQNSEQGPGAGILKHLLGANQGIANQAVSQSSGLDSNQTSQLMQMLAPVLMGSLGAQTKNEGLDATALSGLLRNATQEQEQQAPDAMNMISKLLDSNGDGNSMDDVTKIGMGLLKNFMK
jgi:hypothetical protein